jgi:hypothetical protein
VCPSCGLALPAGSTSCPECGRAIVRPPVGAKAASLKNNNNRSRRTTWLGAVAWFAALAIGVFLFQFGYGSIYLASILPLVACGLLYQWERSRGLRPGWQFYALSAMSVPVAILFGFIWVLVPVLIYFLWIRQRISRERLAGSSSS